MYIYTYTCTYIHNHTKRASSELSFEAYLFPSSTSTTLLPPSIYPSIPVAAHAPDLWPFWGF